MSNAVVEKRTVTRFCVPFSARFSSDKTHREYLLLGKDINMKGVKVVSRMPLEFVPGSRIALCLEFPQESLSVQGRVMWVKRSAQSNEIGIHFERIIDEYKQEIFNYIFNHYPEQFTQRWWQQA